METHHEISAYVQGRNAAQIAEALRQSLVVEGMIEVDRADGMVPDVASEQCHVWRVAVIPARASWHFLLCAPDALLCESRSDGAIRFVALCAALGTAGFLREAEDSDDYVGFVGAVELLADGLGNHRIRGEEEKLSEDGEYQGEPKWRGHAFSISDAADDTGSWPVIRAEIPVDRDAHPDSYEPNLRAAQTSLQYAERLAGRCLSKFWRDNAEAWELLKVYLRAGDPVPVEGAITLTFKRPLPDRIWPKVVYKVTTTLPDFRYGDGSSARIGDRVIFGMGFEGEIVNLLYSATDKGAWPRYIVVTGQGRSRAIEPDRDGSFTDVVLAQPTDKPGTKPGVDELEQRAEAGNTAAIMQLGFIYYVGDGLPANAPRSHSWLARAAERGHPDACRLLASLHRSENGVPYDQARIDALNALVDSNWCEPDA